MAVDALAEKHNAAFAVSRLGHTCTLRIKGKQIFLLKPSTYMNLSGKAVRYHLTENDIPLSQLLVITDDLNLPFGKMRMRPSGSHGGHNGLTDIQTVMESTQYARLRLGVGNDFPKGGQADYVLSPFKKEEQAELPPLLKRVAEFQEAFIFTGIERAMSQFNN
jgi:PTH1 family peptidyl-tRNA hydrolase